MKNNCCKKCDVQLEDDKPTLSCEHCSCHSLTKKEIGNIYFESAVRGVIAKIRSHNFQLYRADNVLMENGFVLSYVSRKEHLIDIFDLNKLLLEIEESLTKNQDDPTRSN